MINQINVNDLQMTYKSSGFNLGPLNFSIKKGAILGLVGESGCGKSSLGRFLAGYINEFNAKQFGISMLNGEINVEYDNEKIELLREANRRSKERYFRSVQMILQDHRSSLNNAMTVSAVMKEAFKLGNNGLDKEYKSYTSSQLLRFRLVDNENAVQDFEAKAINGLSGGQLKRISILKTFLLNPEFIIADEPLTGLDVSIKESVINMLMSEYNKRLNSKNPLTLVIISHDIGFIAQYAKSVIVMEGNINSGVGKIVDHFENESFPYKPRSKEKKEIMENSEMHDHTRMLIESDMFFKSDLKI